ncbi:MAG: DUF5069 domain-containing protein [Candidatus Sericytochromatia bacterium]|nr:DUF5069 domain-containing protein [Candidatus Sericytochromatia bacterium]
MNAVVVKDLRKDYPRSPYETLGGIPWLARLIDKVRAAQAGQLGEYMAYPCGGDRHFLATAGVEPEALKAVIESGQSDEAIAAWLKSQMSAGWETRFEAYQLQARGPVSGDYATWLAEAKAKLAAERPELDLRAADNFNRLICLEEGHPLPDV